jgi:hypothetical protein
MKNKSIVENVDIAPLMPTMHASGYSCCHRDLHDVGVVVDIIIAVLTLLLCDLTNTAKHYWVTSC